MLDDSATICRMRKHRERLYLGSQEPAVGLLSRAVDAVAGWFKKPEEPEISPEQIEQEIRQKQEIANRWKIFESAWSNYVEKRKEYHALYGGGEAFELTKREINYRKRQTARQLRNEAPEPLPSGMENWQMTAEYEARKSREALQNRLSEAKMRAWEKRWSDTPVLTIFKMA